MAGQRKNHNMIALLQRVLSASVTIDEQEVGKIEKGILLFLGITHQDTEEDIDWLVKKISLLRIFPDEEGKMNKDIHEINGDILVVSQFTLHASTKKGNRPSFIESAPPEIAQFVYQLFIKKLQIELGKSVSSGKFGADMQVELINDGPITIILDSKNKK